MRKGRGVLWAIKYKILTARKLRAAQQRRKWKRRYRDMLTAIRTMEAEAGRAPIPDAPKVGMPGRGPRTNREKRLQ